MERRQGWQTVVSRFEAIGHFVYEKGDRIGVTLDEAAIELARKLNAYQMRVERLKAEVERLTAFTTRTIIPNEELQAQVERLTKLLGMCESIDYSIDVWIESKRNAAKDGKQS